MTTETLKEADRYLLNKGFTCKSSKELGNGYQASYELGTFRTRADRGIVITLQDYGDGKWSHTLVAFSKNLAEQARDIEQALSQLPGFEPHRM